MYSIFAILKYLHSVNILYVLFFVFFSFSEISNAQHANFWYFGNSAGLDFSSGAPAAINNGSLSTDEGCSALSDSAGNLLLYTNGVIVYNANHQVMNNGTGLGGHNSTTQSALIVPRPVLQ